MSDAEPGQSNREQSEGHVRPVKRSRTGCLTCRTRRRKCDEARPICQNCTLKGLECRYAAAFQFLGKNNYTPIVENHVKYVNVEFVDSDEMSRDAMAEQRLSEAHSNDSVLNPGRPDATFRTQLDSPHNSADIVPQRTELQPGTGKTSSPNRYEFAVNGLLALSGTEPMFVPSNNELELPEVAPRQEPNTPVIGTLSMGSETSHNETRAQHVWHTDGPSQSPMPGEHVQGIAVTDYAVFESDSTNLVDYQHTPQTAGHGKVANLGSNTANFIHQMWPPSLSTMSTHDQKDLTAFRYEIAPWLDMCDSSQPFGVQVLVASVESTTVRESILNLARTTKNKAHIHYTINDGERGALQHELHSLVPRIFELLEKVAINLANFWEDREVVQTGCEILELLLPQLNNAPVFAEAAYWLVVRLLLGCAIMSATPLRMPLPFLAHSRLPSTPGVPFAEFTQNAIALAVDVVMFSQGDDDRWLQQRYGLNRVEVWKTLLHGLGLWYKSRPQEFQPMIELYPKDGVRHDHDFPTIIFTSGAALLANQLYHTAMMLLLQHKPRFDARIGSSSTSMSKMWHIHRICGIAINNLGAESWDPCLIASFIVTARTVTHKSQLSAVLSALQNVQRLTGWSVLRHLEDLSIECV